MSHAEVHGWERVGTLYQSEDPSPSQPTHRKKKNIKNMLQKEIADYSNNKALALLLKLASSTQSNRRSLRSFHSDSDRGTIIGEKNKAN